MSMVDVHSGMVGVLLELVRLTKGTCLRRVYYVAVRTSLGWPFWPSPRGLSIDAVFAVRI